MEEGFAQLQQQIFTKRPILRQIIEQYGSYSLWDYAGTYSQAGQVVSERRQNELIKVIADITGGLLGRDVAEGLSKQLKNFYYASTADHHGPICHPFFVHSDLLAAASAYDNHLPYLLVLACSNVSLNNSSYPRGLLFHTKGQNKFKAFSFFSSAERHVPVFYQPGYGPKRALLLRDYLHGVLGGQLLSSKLENLAGIYSHSELTTRPRYSDQITKMNFQLWKKMFSGQAPLSDLIYLNQEDIALALLGRHHLSDQTRIHALLFDPEAQRQVLKNFDGIPGSFSLKEKKGTYLFWAYDKGKRQRSSLWLKDGRLISDSGSFTVAMQPEAIAQAIEKGELMPSVLLTAVLLSCYYGIKCLGGFSQTTYLSWMQEAYRKIFSGEKNTGESKALCGDLIFADVFHPDWKTGAAATGLDMALYGDEESFSRFLDLAKKKTLLPTLHRVMPLLHAILFQNNWPSTSTSLPAYTHEFTIPKTAIQPIFNL